jgi:hypothetical protein
MALPEVGGSLLEGGAAQGLIAGLPPPFDRRLIETSLGQMVGDEFGLGRDSRGEGHATHQLTGAVLAPPLIPAQAQGCRRTENN